ncbi:hypothetical protein HCR_04030 [Hydrogenimonas cancrithermarum]|uniref:Uncharacterized protein n=1 Tax=Hydrogenimonas cancrithermarum TaxID=2993563 RepID=A0ABM8FII0_9BACT|nr:hypothetical protein HCR_04030 [Hydrogenimonas cancrithermarum]
MIPSMIVAGSFPTNEMTIIIGNRFAGTRKIIEAMEKLQLNAMACGLR